MHPDVRVILQAGKFDATDDQWRAMLDHHESLADVILPTETSRPTLRRVLQTWADHAGWYLWHPEGAGANECAILSREPIRRARARRLTQAVLKTARKAPIHAVSGRTHGMKVGLWHSPAHNGGLANNWPTRVYLWCWAALRRLRFDVFGGDFNVHLQREDMQDQLRLPGMRWTVPSNQRPTFANKILDGLQVSRRVTVVRPAVTLRRMAGFDHSGVLVIVRKRARR